MGSRTSVLIILAWIILMILGLIVAPWVVEAVAS